MAVCQPGQAWYAANVHPTKLHVQTRIVYGVAPTGSVLGDSRLSPEGYIEDMQRASLTSR